MTKISYSLINTDELVKCYFTLIFPRDKYLCIFRVNKSNCLYDNYIITLILIILHGIIINT